MNDALRVLLENLDDPVYAEAPPGWDWRLAESRFVELARSLEERLGHPCPPETGTHIQDASFHGQIVLPRDLRTDAYLVALRASNFDHLATLYDDDTIVRPDARLIILATLTEHGYTYVPSAVLETPYTGKNPGLDGFSSWAERYFDWI